MVRKREHFQRAAVLWAKMLCWCQRSEENGQTGLSPQKGNRKSITRHNRGMQKSISEHTSCPWSSRRPHKVPLLETEATVHMGLPKIGEMLPGLLSFDFCVLHLNGRVINRRKPSSHVSIVQAATGDGVGDIFLTHFRTLVRVENNLNPTYFQ